MNFSKLIAGAFVASAAIMPVSAQAETTNPVSFSAKLVNTETVNSGTQDVNFLITGVYTNTGASATSLIAGKTASIKFVKDPQSGSMVSQTTTTLDNFGGGQDVITLKGGEKGVPHAYSVSVAVDLSQADPNAVQVTVTDQGPF